MARKRLKTTVIGDQAVTEYVSKLFLYLLIPADSQDAAEGAAEGECSSPTLGRPFWDRTGLLLSSCTGVLVQFFVLQCDILKH